MVSYFIEQNERTKNRQNLADPLQDDNINEITASLNEDAKSSHQNT